MNEYTKVEELQSHYSDFYKDVHGFRPRSSTDEQWNSEEWLSGEIDGLHAYLKDLGSTPAGRVQLREMGFCTDDKEADEEYAAAEIRARDEEEARYQEADRQDAVLAELLAPPTQAEQFEMDMK
ncbi:MAG: hypothetical protein RI909_576 [Bacteroidota bacterium]